MDRGKLWYREGDEWFFDWRSFLTPRWQDALFLLIVLFLAFFYVHDLAKCEMVIEDPVGWCNSSGACQAYAEKTSDDEVVRFEDFEEFVGEGDS